MLDMTDKKKEPDKDKKPEPIPFDEAIQRLLRAPSTTNDEVKKKRKEEK